MCDPEYTRLRRRIATLEADRDRLRAALLTFRDLMHCLHESHALPPEQCQSGSCRTARAALEPAP